MTTYISVIIPVYNVEKYLDDCLRSAISEQNGIELICINDGSTDESYSILQKYKNNYSSMIKIINHEVNKGLSAARNTGIKHSQGKYLLFLDSDDMLEPYAYSTIIEIMESNNLDALCYNSNVIWENEKLKQKFSSFYRWYNPSYNYPVMNGKEFFWRTIQSNFFREPLSQWCIKRESLHTSFKEGIYFEDELFTLQMLLYQSRVFHINDRLYIRRYRENSIITSKPNEKKTKDLVYIINTLINTYRYENDKLTKKAILHRMNWLYNLINKNFISEKEYKLLKEKIYACE